jgi:fibronectin type 3 domain-containing protein
MSSFQTGPEMLRTIEARRDRVVLMWIPARSNQSGIRYQVFRGDSPQFFMPIGETTMGNFTDTMVQPGRTYYYYVVAIDSMGMQSPTSEMIGVNVPF